MAITQHSKGPSWPQHHLTYDQQTTRRRARLVASLLILWSLGNLACALLRNI